jgi:hypothetical protein
MQWLTPPAGAGRRMWVRLEVLRHTTSCHCEVSSPPVSSCKRFTTAYSVASVERREHPAGWTHHSPECPTTVYAFSRAPRCLLAPCHGRHYSLAAPTDLRVCLLVLCVCAVCCACVVCSVFVYRASRIRLFCWWFEVPWQYLTHYNTLYSCDIL